MHHGCVARANEGGEGSGGVVADIAKLSVGREEYYTRELATDHEQYLSGHGESPGRWYGAGATSLGLEGEASVAGFQAMFEGRDPTTGELLGRPHGRNAVPAFDVVLRPTKSVSILYGLGDPATGRAVLAAHHAGLAEAVAYLDEHLGARRGHGGVRARVRTGAAGGRVRPPDIPGGRPAVAHPSGGGQPGPGAGRTLDGLGRPGPVPASAGRGRHLPGHLPARAVRTLGVEWTAADRHGNRELQGMPEELVRGFSKRTDQIDVEVERLEADGRERTPRLVKWAVQATRKPKEHEAPDTLYGRWRTEAAERGVDPDTLVRQVTGRTADRVQDQDVSERTVAEVFDRLAGPDGLTAHASTFARQDVLAALGGRAGRRHPGRAGGAGRPVPGRAGGQRGRRPGAGGAPLVHPRAAGGRAAAGRRRHRPRPASRRPWSPMRRSGPRWPPIRPPARISRRWSGISARAAPASPWSWGGRGPARPSPSGIARHAWQLDGYRLLATAPTGIATV